jgi:hypothetical protein
MDTSISMAHPEIPSCGLTSHKKLCHAGSIVVVLSSFQYESMDIIFVLFAVSAL